MAKALEGRMDSSNINVKTAFNHFEQYCETTILHPLNPKCPDIVPKKGEKSISVGMLKVN